MSHSNRALEHQWCDAWLLLAVVAASGKGPASLRDIVAAADAIQHAIPDFHELDGGLARLAAAGLIGRNLDGIELTARGAKLAAETDSGRWHTHQDAIERALGASSWSTAYLPVNAGRGALSPVITKDEYATAVKAYCAE